MVQFDMTGYEAGGGSIALIQDFTNPQLNAFLARLLDVYVPEALFSPLLSVILSPLSLE